MQLEEDLEGDLEEDLEENLDDRFPACDQMSLHDIMEKWQRQNEVEEHQTDMSVDPQPHKIVEDQSDEIGTHFKKAVRRFFGHY